VKTLHAIGLGLKPGDMPTDGQRALERTREAYISPIAAREFGEGFRSLGATLHELPDGFMQAASLLLSLDADDVCYLTAGSPLEPDGLLACLSEKAESAGFEIMAYAAPGIAEAARTALPNSYGASAKAIDARTLSNARPDIDCLNIIFPILDKHLAEAARKALMRYLSPDAAATLLPRPGNPAVHTTLDAIAEQPQAIYGAFCCLLIGPVGFRQAPGSFESLKAVFEALRGEGGCDWDKAQTHASLAKYMAEECYEAIDAINEANMQALKEELGDVLLQVMLHCQIADEGGVFDANSVIYALHEKMIRRHPHVFQNEKHDDLEKMWDEIKKTEHDYKSASEKVASVARGLPAVMRAQKVQKRAADFGMDFAGAKEAIERLSEEIEELKSALQAGFGEEAVKAECGDVLFSAVNAARLAGCDAEAVLHESTAKFIERFCEMESLLKKAGLDFDGLSFQDSENFWIMSKNNIENKKMP